MKNFIIQNAYLLASLCCDLALLCWGLAEVLRRKA